MANIRNDKDDDTADKIKVGETIVKVKTPPPKRVRPSYDCEKCEKTFPSQLDLDEHKKFDHVKKIADVA